MDGRNRREEAGTKYLEREKNRNRWNQEKQKDPSLHFLGGMDVRAQAEDLGNDHVIVNTQGI